MNNITFVEFATPHGSVLQRIDSIQTILENRTPGKNGEPDKLSMILMLNANTKVEIIGETRESLRDRMRNCGMNASIIALPEPEPEPVEIVPVPQGNAVVG